MTQTLDDPVTAPSPSFTAAVATSKLVKTFRGRPAVAGIDLAVPVGSVYGFLGPNGSGKTTTLRMLVGLIRPTAGRVEMLGRSMPTAAPLVMPHVGALIEGPAFHPYLSGTANLARIDAADRFADPRTSGTRIAAALERVGLSAAAAKRYRAFSLGMKQRLAIAAALLQPRRLLILDEPTNGLDPQGTREVRHLVAELAADGTTILVSSHLLSEIEQMCSHVGVMRDGKLVAQGTVTDVRSTRTDRVSVETRRPRDAATVLERLGLTDVGVDTGAASGNLGDVALDSIAPALVRHGVDILGLAVLRPSLEDLFVSLTGEGFDVGG